MKKTSSKAVIVTGVLAMIALQACVMWVWRLSEGQHEQRLANIINAQREQQLIFTMRDAAHKRALSLFRMAELPDPFARDREHLQFMQYANNFVRARNELIALQDLHLRPDAQERPLWESVRPGVAHSARIQEEVAEMLRSGRDSQAHELLGHAVIAAQESVMSLLTEILQGADAAVQKELEREKDSSRTMSVLVLILGGGALGAAVAIGVLVLVRTARVERTLVDQSQHMEKLKDLAESASRAKSTFLANMSHEIRTPLTAIIGFSEALLDRSASASDHLNAAQTVTRCGKHLLQVINDILDLSKIEAEKLHIEKLSVDLFQILDEVRALASVQASGKGIAYGVDYQFPLPASIDSDAMRLKQVLYNLVSNAIKFTHRGGVRVQVRYAAERNLLCFDVIDTGIGMTDEQKKGLFTAFNQADVSTSRKFGGTGLGLYLSRTLCRNLGGDITVESAEGIGSTFTASIDAGVSAAASLITRIPPVLEQMHSQTVIEKRCGAVLLADDVEENRQLISLYLRKVGASVTCVENGLHAVNSALAGAFDLILMDMQMPVMDGLEATTLLRSRGYTRPIIVLTANVMKTDVDKYLHSGFDGFIGKPINRVEFMATVARYLKMADAHKITTSAVALPALRSELLDREPELAELVAKFLRALPDYAAELAALCRSKKWAELTAQLHDFKSMSGNYGFPQISTLALQVEEEIHGEHFDTVPRLIEQLVNMAAQACPAVATN